jgi:hypothetical protein
VNPLKCLRVLNLDGNNIGDDPLNHFFLLLNKNRQYNKIQILNISRNRISKNACPEIRDFLVENRELFEIYLQWNIIDG